MEVFIQRYRVPALFAMLGCTLIVGLNHESVMIGELCKALSIALGLFIIKLQNEIE
jgi:hypothetical protein